MTPVPVPVGVTDPPALADRWRAAGVAAVVGLVAGVLRFFRLGDPPVFVFDETYYAKDAWAVLRTGAERVWADNADERILAGDLSGLTDEAKFASHPPLGKWVIAAGEAVAGLTPLGWRLGVAALGTLAAVVMVYLARRMTRSTALGGLAGLLVALDGLAIVTSRIAVLDGILMFWVVLATALLVRDRDAARDAAPAIRRWRPWRVLMGVSLGLACSVKWSGLPVLAAFGVLTVVWQAGALAQSGVSRPGRRAMLTDAPIAFVTVVGSALLAYLATWAAWFATSDGYVRQWAADNPASGPLADLVPDALRSLWHYHALAYDLLSNLDAAHNWQSSPAGWLLLERPVLFFRDKSTSGTPACAGEECVADILALGTPAIWWVGVAALALAFWRAGGRDDWRGWLVLSGVAATWLPWFAYGDRPIFSSYAVVTLPFLVLAIVLALRVLPDGLNAVGPAIATRGRRWMVAIALLLLAAVVVQAWFFWPIWTGEPIPLESWRQRIWLPGWS
jgi:dolichyl-phosphate-mannose--protein O-mannosyl transferase